LKINFEKNIVTKLYSSVVFIDWLLCEIFNQNRLFNQNGLFNQNRLFNLIFTYYIDKTSAL